MHVIRGKAPDLPPAAFIGYRTSIVARCRLGCVRCLLCAMQVAMLTEGRHAAQELFQEACNLDRHSAEVAFSHATHNPPPRSGPCELSSR